MDLSNLDNQLATSGEEIPFTCPCCKKEIDLDNLLNHLGPELTYSIANKLLKLVDDDFNQAMNESNNFN